MLRSETSVYSAKSVLNSAVHVSGSSGFFIVKLTSLAMSNLGFIRLADSVRFIGKVLVTYHSGLAVQLRSFTKLSSHLIGNLHGKCFGSS